MRGYTSLFVAAALLSCGPKVDSDTASTAADSTTGPDPTTADPSNPNDTSQPTTATSSTTAATTAASGDTGSLTDGRDSNASIGFIDDFDGGVCHCSLCSIWDQDCPDDERCVPWASDGTQTWNATRCSPSEPDAAPPGQPCTAQDTPASGFDTCDITSMCWNVDPNTLEGTCVAYCTGTQLEPICPDGQSCIMGNDGVITVCLPDCDPFAPSCASNERCGEANDTFACLPTQGGVLDPWGTCNGGPACAEGYTCRPSTELADCNADECCTPLCNLNAPNPDATCPPAHTCHPVFDPAPSNLEHIGLCHLP